MLVYFLILIFILLSGLLSGYYIMFYGKKYDVSLLMSCIILFIFAALRDVTVGADTRQYQIVFQLCAEEKWTKLISSDLYQYWFRLSDIEIGYKYYNKIISIFFKNPQAITIFNSLLIIILIYRLIDQYSKNKWMSIFLFYAFGFYQLSLNLTPSTIAALIALNGLKYIKNKNIIKYLIHILIGSFFHYSVFIFLPLYFLGYLKINKHIFWQLLIITFVIGIFIYPRLLEWLIMVIPKRYATYLIEKERIYQIAVYAVQLILFLFVMLRNKLCNEAFHKYYVEIFLFLLESLTYFIALHSSGVNRVSFLLSPIIIVLIPNFIMDRSFTRYDKRKVICSDNITVIIYGIIVYILRSSVNNIGATIPYQFFW